MTALETTSWIWEGRTRRARYLVKARASSKTHYRQPQTTAVTRLPKSNTIFRRSMIPGNKGTERERASIRISLGQRRKLFR